MSSPANVPSAFASSGRCSSGHDAERCRRCCTFSASLIALNSLETDRDGKPYAFPSSPVMVVTWGISPPDAKWSRRWPRSYGPAPAAWRFCGCSSSAFLQFVYQRGSREAKAAQPVPISGRAAAGCRPSHRWRIPSHRPGPSTAHVPHTATDSRNWPRSRNRLTKAKKYKSADLLRSIMQVTRRENWPKCTFFIARHPPCGRIEIHRTTGPRKWTVTWRHGEMLVYSFAVWGNWNRVPIWMSPVQSSSKPVVCGQTRPILPVSGQ